MGAAAARKTVSDQACASDGAISAAVVQQAFDGKPDGLPLNGDGSMTRAQYNDVIDRLWAQVVLDCGAPDVGR